METSRNIFQSVKDEKRTKVIAFRWAFRKIYWVSILHAISFSMAVLPTMTIAIWKGDVTPYFPFISESACKPPSSTIFKIFLTASAYFFAFDIACAYFYMNLYIKNERHNIANKVFLVTGLTAAIGFVIVAFNPVDEYGFRHFLGVAMTFFCSVISIDIFIWIIYSLPINQLKSKYGVAIALIITAFNIILYFTAAVGFSKYPLKDSRLWGGHKTPNEDGFYYLATSGFAQYLIVFCNVLFHLNFIREMKKITCRFKLSFSLKEVYPKETTSFSESQPDTNPDPHKRISIKTELLPMVYLVCLILATVPTYILAIGNGDVTSYAPYISEAGARQSLFYQSSFIMLSVLQVFDITIALVFFTLCAKGVTIPSYCYKTVLPSIVLSSVGFIVVSLFPMDQYLAIHIFGSVLIYLFAMISACVLIWIDHRWMSHPIVVAKRKYRLKLFMYTSISCTVMLFCGSSGLLLFGSHTDGHWSGLKTPKDPGFYLLCASGIAQFFSIICLGLQHSSFISDFKKIDTRFKITMIRCNEKKTD